MAVPPFEHLRSLARRADPGSRDTCVEVLTCLGSFGDDTAGLVVACRRLLTHQPAEARLWWACARVLTAVAPRAAAAAAVELIERDDTARRLAEALPFPADAPVAVARLDDPIGDALASRPDLAVLLVTRRGHHRGRAAWPGVREATGGAGRTGGDVPGSGRAAWPGVREATLADALRERASPLCLRPAALGEQVMLVQPEVAETVARVREAGARVWAVVPVGVTLPGPLIEAMCRTAGDTLTAVPLEVLERCVGIQAPPGPSHLGCPVAPELLRLGR